MYCKEAPPPLLRGDVFLRCVVAIAALMQTGGGGYDHHYCKGDRNINCVSTRCEPHDYEGELNTGVGDADSRAGMMQRSCMTDNWQWPRVRRIKVLKDGAPTTGYVVPNPSGLQGTTLTSAALTMPRCLASSRAMLQVVATRITGVAGHADCASGGAASALRWTI